MGCAVLCCAVLYCPVLYSAVLKRRAAGKPQGLTEGRSFLDALIRTLALICPAGLILLLAVFHSGEQRLSVLQAVQ